MSIIRLRPRKHCDYKEASNRKPQATDRNDRRSVRTKTILLLTDRNHGDPAGPVEGFYLHRRRDCVDMPVKVWFGAPLDPLTGDEMDRSHRWQIMLVNEVLEDWIDVWPRCAALPIDQAEYDYRMARIDFARECDPDDPFGAVNGKIDLFTAPLPFGD